MRGTPDPDVQTTSFPTSIPGPGSAGTLRAAGAQIAAGQEAVGRAWNDAAQTIAVGMRALEKQRSGLQSSQNQLELAKLKRSLGEAWVDWRNNADPRDIDGSVNNWEQTRDGLLSGYISTFAGQPEENGIAAMQDVEQLRLSYLLDENTAKIQLGIIGSGLVIDDYLKDVAIPSFSSIGQQIAQEGHISPTLEKSIQDGKADLIGIIQSSPIPLERRVELIEKYSKVYDEIFARAMPPEMGIFFDSRFRSPKKVTAGSPEFNEAAIIVGEGTNLAYQQPSYNNDPFEVIAGYRPLSNFGYSGRLQDLTLKQAADVAAQAKDGVGAFQIIATNIRHAYQDWGLLNENAKFSKENQRKIAKTILEKQGYGAWNGVTNSPRAQAMLRGNNFSYDISPNMAQYAPDLPIDVGNDIASKSATIMKDMMVDFTSRMKSGVITPEEEARAENVLSVLSYFDREPAQDYAAASEINDRITKARQDTIDGVRLTQKQVATDEFLKFWTDLIGSEKAVKLQTDLTTAIETEITNYNKDKATYSVKHGMTADGTPIADLESEFNQALETFAEEKTEESIEAIRSTNEALLTAIKDYQLGRGTAPSAVDIYTKDQVDKKVGFLTDPDIDSNEKVGMLLSEKEAVGQAWPAAIQDLSESLPWLPIVDDIISVPPDRFSPTTVASAIDIIDAYQSMETTESLLESFFTTGKEGVQQYVDAAEAVFSYGHDGRGSALMNHYSRSLDWKEQELKALETLAKFYMAHRKTDIRGSFGAAYKTLWGSRYKLQLGDENLIEAFSATDPNKGFIDRQIANVFDLGKKVYQKAAGAASYLDIVNRDKVSHPAAELYTKGGNDYRVSDRTAGSSVGFSEPTWVENPILVFDIRKMFGDPSLDRYLGDDNLAKAFIEPRDKGLIFQPSKNQADSAASQGAEAIRNELIQSIRSFRENPVGYQGFWPMSINQLKQIVGTSSEYQLEQIEMADVQTLSTWAEDIIVHSSWRNSQKGLQLVHDSSQAAIEFLDPDNRPSGLDVAWKDLVDRGIKQWAKAYYNVTDDEYDPKVHKYIPVNERVFVGKGNEIPSAEELSLPPNSELDHLKKVWNERLNRIIRRNLQDKQRRQ